MWLCCPNAQFNNNNNNNNNNNSNYQKKIKLSNPAQPDPRELGGVEPLCGLGWVEKTPQPNPTQRNLCTPLLEREKGREERKLNCLYYLML